MRRSKTENKYYVRNSFSVSLSLSIERQFHGKLKFKFASLKTMLIFFIKTAFLSYKFFSNHALKNLLSFVPFDTAFGFDKKTRRPWWQSNGQCASPSTLTKRV